MSKTARDIILRSESWDELDKTMDSFGLALRDFGFMNGDELDEQIEIDIRDFLKCNHWSELLGELDRLENFRIRYDYMYRVTDQFEYEDVTDCLEEVIDEIDDILLEGDFYRRYTEDMEAYYAELRQDEDYPGREYGFMFED